MKLTLKPQPRNKPNAFTLIEMIGVLAIIAILAAVLIPKVFNAINNARVNNAAMSCQTVKTALIDHYAKYGVLATEFGTNSLTLPYNSFDQILLEEQFLDKPLATKISTNAFVELRNIGTGGDALKIGGTVDATVATGFALAGYETNNVVGSTEAIAVLQGVTGNDARDLSERIDGDAASGMTQTDPTLLDADGRVKYAAPDTSGLTTVYIYLTHR